jgi:hypothetical protein
MNGPELTWLAGDHHVHTAYSHDGTYTVVQQAEAAARHGLAWMVVTDHAGADHAKLAVGPTHDDIVKVRASLPQLLLFQGLEWNVPGSEHGTVFMAPGPHELGLLRRFEEQFDGMVRFGERGTDSRFAGTALDGLTWLADQVGGGLTGAALFVINHPSRRGLVSPRQLRSWNDACPDIAVGMEGAPGHQAACERQEPRGIYDKGPVAGSASHYPDACYRTFGGFDWMTATVGGVWDALLSEGRRWWITANSDSHAVATGDGATPDGRDFWPGAYSRTVVGAVEPSYEAVMQGIRHGRMWVVHGDLIWSLDVRVGRRGFSDRQGVALGGRVNVGQGDDLEVRVNIGLPKSPNGSGQRPRLARVDLITGMVHDPRRRSEAIEAPETIIAASYDVAPRAAQVIVEHTFRNVRQPFYLRLRGTDGHVAAPGSLEPGLDEPGADPWSDLWFYSNPVFIDVGRADQTPS